MLEDFVIRAFAAGIGIALLAAPLGSFVVWRRLSYYGETISHSALLGVSLSLFWSIPPVFGITITVILISMGFLAVQRVSSLSGDTVLGILSHTILATGILSVQILGNYRLDIMGYLFGDILAVSEGDIYLVYFALPFVYGVLYFIKDGLISDTISPELSRAERMKPALVRYIYSVMLALTISLSIKIVGILMIMSLLIIPSATATRLAKSPEMSVFFSVVFGVISVTAGIALSFFYDTASGPSIVLMAGAIFFASLFIKRGP